MDGFQDLRNGWQRKLVTRKTGTRKGCMDVYIKTPDKKTIRSKLMLKKYLQEHKISDINIEELFPSFKKNESSYNEPTALDYEMKPMKNADICIDNIHQNLATSECDMNPRKCEICVDSVLQNLVTSDCEIKSKKYEVCLNSVYKNLGCSNCDMKPRDDKEICIESVQQNLGPSNGDIKSKKHNENCVDIVLQNSDNADCGMKSKKNEKSCIDHVLQNLGNSDSDMKSREHNENCMDTVLQNLDNSDCNVKSTKDEEICVDPVFQNLCTSDCDIKTGNDQIRIDSVIKKCNKGLAHSGISGMKNVIAHTENSIFGMNIQSSSRKKCIRSPYYANIKNRESFKKKLLLSRNRQKWTPPRSPLNLIQESLFDRPWHLLIATIFLNRTSGQLGTQYAWKFFEKWNSPQAVLNAKDEELVEFLKPIGLQEIRASQIKIFTDQFLHKQWKSPDELFGIGKYGKDSYSIFCIGDLKTNPKDSKLKEYIEWYNENFCKTLFK